jgi:acetyl-CoA carboxylase biotin carboxyl carrier protein
MAEKSSPSEHKPGQDWSLKGIKKLIDLLIEQDITDFELEVEGARVHISRGGRHDAAAAQMAAPAPATVSIGGPLTPPLPPQGPSVNSSAAAPAETAAAETTDSLYIIKSPLVGTFYRSPSPNAEPFVTPGDAVRVGQVLCIIEAMKLMNEIESEVNGEIVRVYPDSGQPIEYGQSLFAVKPSMRK